MKVIHRKPYVAPHVKMVVLHHHRHLLSGSDRGLRTVSKESDELEIDSQDGFYTTKGSDTTNWDLYW